MISYIILFILSCSDPVYTFGNDLDDLIDKELWIEESPKALSKWGDEACVILHSDGELSIWLEQEDETDFRSAKWEVSSDNSIKIKVSPLGTVGEIWAYKTPYPDLWNLYYEGLMVRERVSTVGLIDNCR